MGNYTRVRYTGKEDEDIRRGRVELENPLVHLEIEDREAHTSARIEVRKGTSVVSVRTAWGARVERDDDGISADLVGFDTSPGTYDKVVIELRGRKSGDESLLIISRPGSGDRFS